MDEIAVIELCLVQGDDAAWRAFMVSFEPVLRQAHAPAGRGMKYDEFASWFPGWLFEKRGLHSAYVALRRRIDAGECGTRELQVTFLRGYVVKLVRTAIADMYRTDRRPLPPEARERLYPDQTDRCLEAEQLDQLRSALLSLEPQLRIPFWLRHYRALGPLSPEDLEFVSRKSGLPPDQIQEELESQARENANRVQPITSETMGILLDLPPDANGKYVAVDQRVRRARTRLRAMLADSTGDSDAPAAREEEQAS